MKKILWTSLRWSWRLILLAVLFFNFRLYAPSPLDNENASWPTTLMEQLAANRAALEDGSPARMQELFPEGQFFCYALHGLTWIEVGQRNDKLSGRAIEEAEYCYRMLDSAECRSTFNSNLPPDHGMFYSAWKAHLLAGIVELQAEPNGDDVVQLKVECDALENAFEQAGSPFLESYQGGIWPCDSIPAIHAMVTFDRVTGQDRYADFVQSWLASAKELIDPDTGLIPHSNLMDGEMGRATSQMIILRMLPDIDETFARQQYELFRKKYLTTFAGIPCVFEFPEGEGSSWGDVDTGPLISGRSLSATVFMIGTARIYGDRELADAIATAGEVVGLPWTSNGEKRYVGGVLPIGDIMVGYSQNAKRWSDGDGHQPAERYFVSPYWRWPVHLWSMLFFLPAFITMLRRLRKRSDESNDRG